MNRTKCSEYSWISCWENFSGILITKSHGESKVREEELRNYTYILMAQGSTLEYQTYKSLEQGIIYIHIYVYTREQQ